jgi:hypothetical protein
LKARGSEEPACGGGFPRRKWVHLSQIAQEEYRLSVRVLPGYCGNRQARDRAIRACPFVSTAAGSCCADPNSHRWKPVLAPDFASRRISLADLRALGNEASRVTIPRQTFDTLRISGQEFDSLRMRHRAKVPGRLTRRTSSLMRRSGARRSSLRRCRPARASSPAPTYSMPFERMMRAEPATTGLSRKIIPAR